MPLFHYNAVLNKIVWKKQTHAPYHVMKTSLTTKTELTFISQGKFVFYLKGQQLLVMFDNEMNI